MKKIFSYCVLFSLIFSCSSDGTKNQNDKSQNSDTLQTDSLANDVDSVQLSEDSLKAQGYAVDEVEKIDDKIEEKFGEQWDFCNCVIKNDSVQKAVETASDDQIDAILARMEEIDMHCKKMLTQPNTTPEERAKYQRKVNKCLKAK